MPDETEVGDGHEADRHEARVNGELAGFTAYRLVPGYITFTHAGMLAAYLGRGIGNRLAVAALEKLERAVSA